MQNRGFGSVFWRRNHSQSAQQRTESGNRYKQPVPLQEVIHLRKLTPCGVYKSAISSSVEALFAGRVKSLRDFFFERFGTSEVPSSGIKLYHYRLIQGVDFACGVP